MSEPERTRKVTPWLWPLEWASDEKFWRDVASRTVSALIALGVAAFVGFATGVLSVPQNNPWWALLLTVTVGAVTLPIIVLAFSLVEKRPSFGTYTFAVIAVVIMLAGFVLALVLAMGAPT